MNVSARSAIPRGVPALFVVVFSIACSGGGDSSPMAPSNEGGTSAGISSDADFLTLVTQTQSFRSYTPFPGLDTSAAGTLTASSVHQPIIRVSMNSVAAGALQNGRLPAGSSFPDGSVLFKEVLGTNGLVNLYTVMYKDRQNALAANGWLWAELRPNGGAEYSVRNRGGACTSCHALDRGPQNDFVRSFERQR